MGGDLDDGRRLDDNDNDGGYVGDLGGELGLVDSPPEE
jgi:hypothetical protein